MEFNYTLEDFKTSKPYEDVMKIEDDFEREVSTADLAEYAVGVGFKTGFAKRLKAYEKSKKTAEKTLNPARKNVTDFERGELELYTGEWIADDTGVYRYGVSGTKEYACAHPIQPVERLKNIDTGELKVRLAWRRGRGDRRVWSDITTSFDVLSNAKNIVSLANIGISVASGRRAQNLVDYLVDVMDYNYDAIPERKSVSRLGWNEEGFSPYIGDVVFDGNDAFEKVFTSIKPHGSYEKWLSEVKSVRSFSLEARVVLAASFAAPLVSPMGCLPFFVHLWSGDGGTGKSVGQMVAASVWGEPSVGGEYFRTFKGTNVGFEVLAGFLRSLPLFLDDLQLAKDAKGKTIFNVYELASGAGKMRSNTKLGISATPRWANCFITSGETPIVGEQDGSGALNRVIEIECTTENKVIEDGHKTAEIMKLNYGHAGKIFIENICNPENMDEVKKRYSELFQTYVGTKAAEKQAHAASLITLADEFATKWIFNDGKQITVSELADFLKSKESAGISQRGYAYMCDWVAQNANKLHGTADNGDVYGMIGQSGDELGWVYIIRSVWDKTCTDAHISSRALLSHLKSNGLIQTRGKALTKCKTINGVKAECVVMKLRSYLDDGDFDYKEHDDFIEI